mmetsp:Transcript_93222/g.246429  ORF Transcript_93222/g.246429 Transcript_93222/m.246429 type:complete len:206 (+) Transcript_93222:71-688(+)
MAESTEGVKATAASDEVKRNPSGYTYWKRDCPDAAVLADHSPKPIAKDDQALKAEHQQNKAVGSSWNAAGTWEEKEMGPISRPELESILCEDGFPLLEADGGTRICGTSATVTGESQAYNICGRPRLGFEFEVKVQWKGTFEGEDVEGKMEIKDLDSTDLDGCEVRPTTKQGSEAAKKAVEKLKKEAKPFIKKAAEELSKRMLAR